jgi:hypothetical protein
VREDIISMSQRELKRLHLIKKALEKEITQEATAELLGLSSRQVRRIIKTVRCEGDEGIIHKSRGRESNRAITAEIKEKVLSLYQKKYPDFGPTLGSEKLWERDKIKINDETLRLWLIDRDIEYQGRKKRPHRQWRERKESFGEMLQLDGSRHKWFEERGPESVLMCYIDDATGRPFGRFYEYEGTLPALDSFKRYSQKYGLPVSVYLDKHSTYKSSKEASIEEQLQGIEPLSQYERALKEFEVDVIHAHSPQAKGRIERLFRSLQNRLIKEMRLRGIKSIEEANKFLPQYLLDYGKRFGVKPAKSINLHRQIAAGVDLDQTLCIKTSRVVRNDFTVAHEGKLYQIKDNIHGKGVVIEERVNGRKYIRYQDRYLRFKEITTRPEKIQQEEKKPKARRPYILPKDHPWRHSIHAFFKENRGSF